MVGSSTSAIVRCKRCGLVSPFPPDDSQFLKSSYRNLADQEYTAEETGRRVTAARHLQFVQRFVPARGTLLDTACSVAHFEGEASKAGWHVDAVEPSDWTAELAKREATRADIHCALFGEVELPGQSFDCIKMWGVLEHVDDPNAALSKAAGLLKRHGYLSLNVPNIDSWTARLLRGSWPLLLREHLWYFSPSTLTAFLQRAGFSMRELIPNTVTFSWRGVLTRLAQHETRLAPKLSDWLDHAPSLAKSQITFRMGESLAAAQKIEA
jgi:2-polyprenyl-3-methyl-5-hydroxy-6-metoxy-1,4-benzoquinol methylase